MKEYNIAICDDNPTDISFLSDLVSQWAQKVNISVRIRTFLSAESFLFHYEEEKDYDILLLDIEMGTMDGVTMAKRIRTVDDSVQIIFITGYSDYIAEGYEVSALHYLMKPVDPKKLIEVLNRAMERVHRNEKRLVIECGGEIIRIPLFEVRYLEVQRNYVTIHARQDYMVKKTLAEFEHELDERFYRAGRSVIVNLSLIQRVSKKEIELSDGELIPLSRGQYESLNRAIIMRM